MNRKLHRVLDEIRRTEEKIRVWQEHLNELHTQREMLEDAEIIKSVRSMRLGSRELLSVLEGVQNGTVTLSEKQEITPDFDENEKMRGKGLSEGAGNVAEESMTENEAQENTESEREDLINEEEN